MKCRLDRLGGSWIVEEGRRKKDEGGGYMGDLVFHNAYLNRRTLSTDS